MLLPMGHGSICTLFFYVVVVVHLVDGVTVVGPFNLTAKINSDSETVLKEWIDQGSRSRLEIKLTYSTELGLPSDANLCSTATGTKYLM